MVSNMKSKLSTWKKKKKECKIGKKGKHHSKNEDSCGINKTGFQKSKSDVADLQQNDKCGVSTKENGAKTANQLFRNPLLSKKGWKYVRRHVKENKNTWKAIARICGGIFILLHPPILSINSILGLIHEDNVDIINVFIDVGLLANSIYDLISYLDDFEVLFSSILDTAGKSVVGFLADLLLRELIYRVFQSSGLCDQFKNGAKDSQSLLLGLLAFALHLSGNIALFWGREKKQDIR